MNVTAVLSMLHEPAERDDSTARRFRGEAPLAWTLYRLGRCQRLAETAVVCWEDQIDSVGAVALELKSRAWSIGKRRAVPHLDGVAAARRWADGWRGGLLGACEFDRGFYGPAVKDLLEQTGADAVLLVDPSAGLVDFELVDRLIEHADANPEADLCFSPAAPGISGVIVRKTLVDQLGGGGAHPGTLLAYRPDLPMRDAISTPACAPIPTPLARTMHRFTLDSQRQIDRIAQATVHLNGQLISTEAEQLLRFLEASPAENQLPRDLTIELTARRASRPIFSPIGHGTIQRGDMDAAIARSIFEEISAADDARITFGGVGDPLLHPNFVATVRNAHQSGIGALAVETDLLELTGEKIDEIAELPLDIISVHLPAISAATYQAVMGVDGLGQVMTNLTRLVQKRQLLGRGTPLVVPTFMKTAANFAEMDAWYDHWVRVLGCAVIAGPGDYAGQTPDSSIVQMEPPRRRPCVRIGSRLTILSDGGIVSCEQDFAGQQRLGSVGQASIQSVWTGAVAALRKEHRLGNFACNTLCAACKDWHRP